MPKPSPHITFLQLFSGQFAPDYQRDAWALKRLAAKYEYKPDSPMRVTVRVKSPWMGNILLDSGKENIGRAKNPGLTERNLARRINYGKSRF